MTLGLLFLKLNYLSPSICIIPRHLYRIRNLVVYVCIEKKKGVQKSCQWVKCEIRPPICCKCQLDSRLWVSVVKNADLFHHSARMLMFDVLRIHPDLNEFWCWVIQHKLAQSICLCRVENQILFLKMSARVKKFVLEVWGSPLTTRKHGPLFGFWIISSSHKWDETARIHLSVTGFLTTSHMSSTISKPHTPHTLNRIKRSAAKCLERALEGPSVWRQPWRRVFLTQGLYRKWQKAIGNR